MENRKRYKKGQVKPIEIEKQRGWENDSQNHNVAFHMDKKGGLSVTGRDETVKSIAVFKDAARTVTGKIFNPLEVISNMRTNMGQWRLYACSRRVKKRKTATDDDGNRTLSSSGLGLDDIFDYFSDSSKVDKEFPKKDSRLSAVSNQALIQYFAKLGQSKNEDEIIDLDFVHTLLASGADINCTDKHGQTVMHEVARAWHVDVAKFLIEHGANVNKADNFGRTPLHIAAAVDYVEMINMLIENNANKEAKTLDENQTPVFYAAKTDAVQSLKTLILKHGCSYKSIVDYKGRTPIHVAAELDRSETARFLLECEAPVHLSDNQGSRAITWMISKMAPVAKEALQQLYSTDRASRKRYHALNYLVRDKEKDPYGKAQTPLHTAVAFKQYDLLMHPVFQKLLENMWQRFGRFWTIYQFGVNFVYIVMWTVIGIVVEYDKRHIYNMPDDVWRIILYVLAAVFTFYQIFEEVMEFRRSEKMHSYWEESRKVDIQMDMKFCHPRWPEERKYLEMEIQAMEQQKPKYFHDMWNIFDWICYIMLLVCIATHVADIISHTEILARLHIRFMAVTIILLWLRLMKNARAFSILGPFIVMLGHMLKDCVRFLFLYMEFYIPYLAAFWMIFGGTKRMQDNQDKEVSVSGFEYPGQIFFSLFRLTLVDDYDYDGMLQIDGVMADILLSTWFLLSAILSLNLFIALLSDTFQRVYDNAKANAVMQRAIIILNIWEGINQRRKNNFLLYIEENCSPLREEYDDDLTLVEENELQKVTIQIKEDLENLKEMFKLQFGDPRSELSEHGDASEDGDRNKDGRHVHSGHISVHNLALEISDLRQLVTSVKTQQENVASLLHKDMKSVKDMLRELLHAMNTGQNIANLSPVRPEIKAQQHNSPPKFPDFTRFVHSQVFDVSLSPPSLLGQHLKKSDSDNESSTDC
ncbi:hypothetical protein BsWGS_19321 [Bradybaena similaris]